MSIFFFVLFMYFDKSVPVFVCWALSIPNFFVSSKSETFLQVFSFYIEVHVRAAYTVYLILLNSDEGVVFLMKIQMIGLNM